MFRRRFTCDALLCVAGYKFIFVYGTITPYGRIFQNVPLTNLSAYRYLPSKLGFLG